MRRPSVEKSSDLCVCVCIYTNVTVAVFFSLNSQNDIVGHPGSNELNVNIKKTYIYADTRASRRKAVSAFCEECIYIFSRG